ncbi:DNA-3-methyladenine glycosylase [Curtobacterium sp. MCBA15_001]|uniref:DNA-3-methyladenine glycosylase family protein n=1 Tax=Curtobacterium sp. MCBA15_001 TaxID=1898731 RepID=UPI0008DC67F3|nr:DNA-3-methyladenine glycosylase [Curtobacterium sp. MCBA15_001]OIH92421.1 DNA-3-methyladenine glycosylase [Curtobacterium sp. MCBA15_001]
MSRLETVHDVVGPWSLATSRRFWEGFTPGRLASQTQAPGIHTTFLCDTDWQRVDAVITQDGPSVHIVVDGTGDLDAATDQVRRLLSIDIDGRSWPDVAMRDGVIAEAQAQLRGFRPCGFFSPYEAAVWSVLSQRLQIRQAAAIKTRLTQQLGDDGAFPSPAALFAESLVLPGRKAEYLHAIAEAALDGRLSGSFLRSMPSAEAFVQVQGILGMGPFSAELVVIRGANFPDVLPHHEGKLSDEITRRYGTDRSFDEITEAWKPYRSWATVHLRALRAAEGR